MAEGMSSIVISDEDLKRIDDLSLRRQRQMCIRDRNIAALAAGLFSATNELAKLLGEKEFTVTFHQGEETNIHISLLVPQVLLVIVFDNRAPVGAIRFWAKKIGAEIVPYLKNITEKPPESTIQKEEMESEVEKKLDSLF